MRLRIARPETPNPSPARTVRRSDVTKEMQTIVAKAIASLRIAMMAADDEERRMIIEQVIGDYCQHCGSVDPRCQCSNDD